MPEIAPRCARLSLTRWLSQYPHEKEYLIPPLAGLSVSGTSVDGGTLIVKSRLSLNMASLTLEQA